MNDLRIEERTSRYVVLEGPAYEVGRQQAEEVKTDATWVARLTSGDPAQVSPDLTALYERVCPGLREELQGLADGLGVDPMRLLFAQISTVGQRRCSHIVALPSITADGHVLVARTDEGDLDWQDLRLVTVRREGAYAHLGFSILLLGRSDGMNEHGLCVTSSAGGAYETPVTAYGVSDALITRAVLDTCRTVGEAVALLEAQPPVNSANLIVADARGEAALFEANNGSYAVRHIDAMDPAGYLCSGNHTVLPEMVDYNRYVNPYLLENSRTRMDVIAAGVGRARPSVTCETLREMLVTEIPAGLCAYHYRVGFGTVFQMLFDATARTAEVSFGPATHNPWRAAGLDDPVGIQRVAARFPHR